MLGRCTLTPGQARRTSAISFDCSRFKGLAIVTNVCGFQYSLNKAVPRPANPFSALLAKNPLIYFWEFGSN